MKRRGFIAGLGSAAAVALPGPFGVSAQPQRRTIPRLGILLFSNPQADRQMAAVHRGLRELGYVEGRSIVLEYRYAEGRQERLSDLAAELAATRPDVMFALGGDVSAAATKASRTIPIVFTSSADPVQLKFVASLSRPGGNATGVTYLFDELASKRLELLKEAAPRLSRVAVLYNPDHIDNELREVTRAARALGVPLQSFGLKSPADIDAALRAAADARADALYVVSSRLTVGRIRSFVDFATANRLPLAGGFGAWAQAGALLSYGPNIDEMTRRAIGYVDRILKGARPADLPVQQPTRFELQINLKTAKALGLDIPEALLLRADKVIE
jgi:putative ABC transport system substrate-binding protein